MTKAARAPQGPFAQAAEEYLQNGWPVIYLPPGEKWPPPPGTTGWTGQDADAETVRRWAAEHPGANIGTRLPDGILGVDVDAYDKKTGGATLRELEDRLGPLPTTPILTSRNDGTSGIRFFKVPPGQTWPSELGPGVECIHRGHRYAVTWPSRHPSGGTYRWIVDGVDTLAVPCPVADLPELPAEWVGAFAGTYTAAPIRDVLADLSHFAPIGDDGLCERIDAVMEKCQVRAEHGSRHDAYRDAVMAIVQLGDSGHKGAAWALQMLEDAWVDEVGDERGRDADAEWERMIDGALEKVQDRGKETCGGAECFEDWADGIIAPKARGTSGQEGTSEPPGAPSEAAGPIPVWANSLDPDSRPSWAPQDLTDVVAGLWEREQPSLMPLTDSSGLCLLYRGRLHSFHGESESGKSFVAQLEVARVLKQGGTALYIDMEADKGSVVNRLREMGVEPADILARFAYVQPERSPVDPEELGQFKAILGSKLDLVVWDGVTDALGLFRASSRDENDVRRFMRFARHLTKTGAAVVNIDHVTKDRDTRGRFALGSQHKMAALDGAAYVVDVETPIAPGSVGELHLRVAKDRPGSVRAACNPKTKRRDRTHLAAVVTIDSRDGITYTMRLGDERDVKDEREQAAGQTSTPPRLAYGPIAEKVSDTLSKSGPMSRTRLAEAVGRKGGNGNKQFNAVVDDLIQTGFIDVDSSGKYIQLVHRRLFVLAQESLMEEK